MTWPRLINPPIKEAVFDLKFEQGVTVPLEKLQNLSESLKNEYPVINEMFMFQMGAKIKQGMHPEVSSDKTVNGFKLTAPKKAFILQLRIDGLTLSKIAPYISWEELSKEAKPLLEKFSSLFPELRVKRLALRYINSFNLDFGNNPINSYINILPSYPIDLPQSVDGL